MREGFGLAELFRNNLWPGLAVCVALYVSDYFLTITCARLYQAGVRDKIVFEGSYEITPYYQKDIDSLRLVSPRFLAVLLLLSVWLSALWWLAVQVSLPDIYFCSLGMLILLELAIHKRHLRNLFLFRAIMRNSGVRGRIEYSRPLTLRMSALDLFNFAGLFFFYFWLRGVGLYSAGRFPVFPHL
jgi:hypothetical protein